MITGLVVVPTRPGTVLPVVRDEGAGGDATAVAGAVEIPGAFAVGRTLIIGTAAAELTPRLPISVDPSGIPVRAAPPGVVDMGVGEDATPLEPDPHIPDVPDVPSMSEVVASPDVAGISV